MELKHSRKHFTNTLKIVSTIIFLKTTIFQNQTLETYFQELNFNIIQYCEENYSENESNHSESLENEETKAELETEDIENEEEMVSTYIAKIPEFTEKNSETSLQKWLDKVSKAGDANGWNAARMLKTIPYFLQGTAGEWFENLEVPPEH
ncbi:hypothetical protein G9A89_003868 [Geosiphon pyriformis]|nr:hypothetical protein G9A89_003868 [Geosiphon pyriformis]